MRARCFQPVQQKMRASSVKDARRNTDDTDLFSKLYKIPHV